MKTALALVMGAALVLLGVYWLYCAFSSSEGAQESRRTMGFFDASSPFFSPPVARLVFVAMAVMFGGGGVALMLQGWH
jgi:amino acid permease